jgi:hypothetical protein
VNIGRGTNDMGSIAGAGLIVCVGGVLLGLDSELMVGKYWLDVESVMRIVVASGTEEGAGEERSVLENGLVE